MNRKTVLEIQEDPARVTHRAPTTPEDRSGMVVVELDHAMDPRRRWEIKREVGVGGVGRVMEAFDHVMRRHSAIKTLNPELSHHEGLTAQFIKEARLTGLLEHPHIAPVHEIGVDEHGQYFFSMKLIAGETLTTLIYTDRPGETSYDRLFRLLGNFVKVCDALAFAHSKGVIHCDIKSENVMVGRFGQAFLMDWGIAMPLGDPEAAAEEVCGSPVGSPMFMSPEQAHGVRLGLTTATDIYSLGVMLYELVAKTVPFQGNDLLEIVAKVQRGEFLRPSEAAVGAWIPRALEQVIMKAMSLRPEDRFETVLELQHEIERFMRNDHDFPSRMFEPGEVVVRQGDAGDRAYVISSGVCDVYVCDDEGEKLVKTLREGELFGETSILTDAPRNASVIAREPSLLVEIPRAVILGEVESLKPWMATLLSTLAERFSEASQQVQRLRRRSTPRDVLIDVLKWFHLLGEEVGDDVMALPMSQLEEGLRETFGQAPRELMAPLSRMGALEFQEARGRVLLHRAAEHFKVLRQELRRSLQ